MQGIQRDEAKAAHQVTKKPRSSSLVVWGLVLFAVAFAAAVLQYELEEKRIVMDLRESSLELLLEADADVFTYYTTTRNLPTELPDPLLRNFVRYEPINEYQFYLQSTYGSNADRVLRDIRVQTSYSELDATLSD
jgi:hypothetical protein